jgi:VWFA-related protein
MRCALILALAAVVSAQDTRFDVRSRLVLVPATVTDGKGRPVDGLRVGDFEVLDRGHIQRVTLDTFDTGLAPIALAIVVQSSGISAPVVEKVRKIGSMIAPLITGERGCAALVAFDQRVAWLQECTKDQSALDRAFAKLRPELHAGETKEAHMLDAVHVAVERLRSRANSRRVLLLISESRDRGSEASLEEVVTETQAAGVAVYAATYSALKTGFTSDTARTEPRRGIKPKTPSDAMGTLDGKPPTQGNQQKYPEEQQVDAIAAVGELARLFKANAAEALTEGTGGTTFPFTRQKALEQAIDKLGAELHTQYVLSFVPEMTATVGYHRLDVRVRREGDIHIRARPGYWVEEGK